MASASVIPTEEKAACLRLLSLVIDGGSEVLLHQFHQRIPQKELAKKLQEASTRDKLLELRKRKVLNQDQWNCLYRQLGQPDSAQFDVTLLTTLLRYVCGLDENSPVWNKKPSPTDLSVEADIARLKTIRNKMSHMKRLSLSEDDFQMKWNKAEQVILRLGRGIPEFTERIQKLKNCSIDPVMEKEYQDKLSHYEEMERNLKTDLEIVKDSLANFDKDLEMVKSQTHSEKHVYATIHNRLNYQDKQLGKIAINQEKLVGKFKKLNLKTREQEESIEEIFTKQARLETSMEQTSQTCKSSIVSISDQLQQTRSKSDDIHLRVNQGGGDIAPIASRTLLHVDDDDRKHVFVSTHAHKEAREILGKSGLVILTGQPGEGKTTLALELLAEMQTTRTCLKLNEPEDWKAIDLDRDKVDVILLDDIFGGGALDDRLFGKWSRLLPDISKAVQKKRIQAIITSRHYILEEAKDRLQKQHMFQDKHIVRMSSHDLSEEEKKLMLEAHLRHASRELTPGLIGDCIQSYDHSFNYRPSYFNDLKQHILSGRKFEEYLGVWKLQSFKSMIGFPEIVSLFARHDHLFNKGVVFFSEPLLFFKQCMEDLFLDPEKFMALLLVWTRPNKEIRLVDLEPPDVSRELQETAIKFGFKLKGKTITSLRKSLEYHRDGFLLFDPLRGSFKFCHNIVKDMVGLVSGKQYPKIILQYASIDFLMHYVSIDNKKCQDGLHVFIEEYRYGQLADALWNNLSDPQSNEYYERKCPEAYNFFGLHHTGSSSLNNLLIFNHDSFENDQFVRVFVEKDTQHVLFSQSIGIFTDTFGNYGISLNDNIPVYVPSLALLLGKVGFLNLILEYRDSWNDIIDENFLRTNTLLAIHKGLIPTVELLFRHGSLVNEDAIYLAARTGNVSILNFLLANKPKVYDYKLDVSGSNSPLMAAVKAGSEKCVEALLNDKRDGNYRNAKGWTALDIGIFNGNVGVCKILLEYGVSVDYKSGKFQQTPLHRSADLGKTEITKLLLEYGASVDVRDRNGRFPLHCAVFSGHHEIMDMLLKVKPGSKQLKYHGSYSIKSALFGADLYHVAVWKNKPQVIEVLTQNKMNPNVRDFYGRTPFYRAVYERKIDSIKALILLVDKDNAKKKAIPPLDTNLAENHGYTPLHAAVHLGHTEIVKLICLYVDVNAQDRLGRTPLHTACRKLDLEIFEVLIKEYHADYRMVTADRKCVFDILKRQYKIQAASRDRFKHATIRDEREPRWVDFLNVVKTVDEDFARNWKYFRPFFHGSNTASEYEACSFNR